MGVTPGNAKSPVQALDWLLLTSAYVRFEAGPPALVRVVVRDPLDADQQVDVHRVVVDDISAEHALLEAVREAQASVAAAQEDGHFQFVPAEERGWRPDGTPGW